MVVERSEGGSDAYAGEWAKLLAQSHNLDRLIEQNERLTTQTEALKSRVPDEMGDRQQRWKFKRMLSLRLLITVVKSIRTVEFTAPDWAKSCEHNMGAFQVSVSKLFLAAAKDLSYPALDSGTTSIPAFTLLQGIWEPNKT